MFAFLTILRTVLAPITGPAGMLVMNVLMPLLSDKRVQSGAIKALEMASARYAKRAAETEDEYDDMVADAFDWAVSQIKSDLNP